MPGYNDNVIATKYASNLYKIYLTYNPSKFSDQIYDEMMIMIVFHFILRKLYNKLYSMQ